MEKYINFYERKLTIEQVGQILPDLDDEMVHDLAVVINQYNNVGQILFELDNYTSDKSALNKLYLLFGRNYKEFMSEFKGANSNNINKSKDDTPVEADVITREPEVVELSESPKIETGKKYETNRKIRDLCPITEIPSADFDMPSVPEIK